MKPQLIGFILLMAGIALELLWRSGSTLTLWVGLILMIFGSLLICGVWDIFWVIWDYASIEKYSRRANGVIDSVEFGAGAVNFYTLVSLTVSFSDENGANHDVKCNKLISAAEFGNYSKDSVVTVLYRDDLNESRCGILVFASNRDLLCV